jgi:hypothetical protein
MEELEKLALQLMVAVRDMPPSQKRQDALKEIGKLRAQLNALEDKDRLRARRFVRSPKSKPKEDSARD